MRTLCSPVLLRYFLVFLALWTVAMFQQCTWTTHENTSAQGGNTPVAADNPAQCQTKCEALTGCVAVLYDSDAFMKCTLFPQEPQNVQVNSQYASRVLYRRQCVPDTTTPVPVTTTTPVPVTTTTPEPVTTTTPVPVTTTTPEPVTTTTPVPVTTTTPVPVTTTTPVPVTTTTPVPVTTTTPVPVTTTTPVPVTTTTPVPVTTTTPVPVTTTTPEPVTTTTPVPVTTTTPVPVTTTTAAQGSSAPGIAPGVDQTVLTGVAIFLFLILTYFAVVIAVLIIRKRSRVNSKEKDPEEPAKSPHLKNGPPDRNGHPGTFALSSSSPTKASALPMVTEMSGDVIRRKAF